MIQVHRVWFLVDLDGFEGPPVPVSPCCGAYPGGIPVDAVLVFLDVDSYAILHVSCFYCISVFGHPLLHASLGFTNVLHLTVTTWNFIDNFFPLLHWGFHFHLH